MRKLTLLLLPILLFGCANDKTIQSNSGYPAPPDPLNWGKDFYYASAAARGFGYCQSVHTEGFKELFEQRFGRRFERLKKRYKEKYGEPKSFSIILTCRQFKGSGRAARSRHRIAMRKFRRWLVSAEAALEEPMINKNAVDGEAAP